MLCIMWSEKNAIMKLWGDKQWATTVSVINLMKYCTPAVRINVTTQGPKVELELKGFFKISNEGSSLQRCLRGAP